MAKFSRNPTGDCFRDICYRISKAKRFYNIYGTMLSLEYCVREGLRPTHEICEEYEDYFEGINYIFNNYPFEELKKLLSFYNEGLPETKTWDMSTIVSCYCRKKIN